MAGTFEPLIVGDILVDLDGERAYRAGRPLELSHLAFGLLACLASQPGRVFSRDELHYAIWGCEFVDSERLRQHIYVLRAVLGRPCPLCRVRNVGIKLDRPVVAASEVRSGR